MENDSQEKRARQSERWCEPTKEEISKEGKQMMTEETIVTTGDEVFAKKNGSRLQQILSRHQEIFEDLDRADKLVAGKKSSLLSTLKNTVESTERAWSEAVQFQQVMKKTGRCGVLYMAEAEEGDRPVE